MKQEFIKAVRDFAVLIATLYGGWLIVQFAILNF